MRCFLKSGLCAAALAVLAFFTGSCASVRSFDNGNYPLGAMASFPPPQNPPTVVVHDFLDQRALSGPALSHEGDRGSLGWGLVPLMPFGYTIKPEPERSECFISTRRYLSSGPRELAQMATRSLEASGLFKKVSHAQAGATDAEYIWRGTVKSMEYRGYMWTYCVTYLAAPLLWAAGLPTGMSTDELAITFDLVKSGTGEIVWTYEFKGTERIVHGLYYNVGDDLRGFPVLMTRAMNLALADLARHQAEK